MLKYTLHKRFVKLFIVVFVYIFAMVVALRFAGVWDASQFKNTILWSLTVACVSVFRVNKIDKDQDYFKNAVFDNLKIVAIIEFIVAFHNFSIITELAIVPVIFSVAVFKEFTDGKREHSIVNAIASWILFGFGLFLVGNAAFRLAGDFWGFAKPETLNNFTLPITLTILFLPFIFSLALFVRYELAFVRLGIIFKENERRRYAKRAAVILFNVRTNLLMRWLRDIRARTPSSNMEIRASIARTKELAEREKHPKQIPLEKGWSPFLAGEFLVERDLRLRTGDYHQDFDDDDQWFASSPYKEIGEALFANNLAYYVEGDEHIARRLKLVANVNDPETALETRQYLEEVVCLLIRCALSCGLPEALSQAIKSETSIELEIEGKIARLQKESWPSERGYNLIFVLESRNLH